MLKVLLASLAVCAAAGSVVFVKLPAISAAEAEPAPKTLPVPADYREWIYLTSGMDMTYTAATGSAANMAAGHKSVFDNVFVNPEAYRVFKRTGAWPDQTVFVLENRAGEQNISINKGGRTQGAAITGIELHAKVHNQWIFYSRHDDGLEHLITQPASCYTCHEAHAAVDTTFVQFYPTLLPVAEAKHVLNPEYKAEMGAPVGK